MQVDVGKKLGVSSTSTVNPDVVQSAIRGAEQGSKDSMHFYALLKLYGNGVTQDSIAAAKYFKRAANLGHVEAQTAYAVMLLSGNGVSPDTSEAITYLRKAVEGGDGEAAWLLGVALIETASMKPTEQKATESTEELLKKQRRKFQESLTYLQRAANDHHIAQAEYYLGLMYEYAIGVEQNFYIAMEYYRRATEQLNPDALYNLALMYTYGRGCNQDYRRAFAYFDNAVRIAGHKSAAYYLGVFHMYGYTTEPSYEKAMNWFEFAAGADDPVIAAKAVAAANEIGNMITLATEEMNSLQESWRNKAEKVQKSGASYGGGDEDE